ncbi:MAG TPA: PQQ-binding-like beta-propeller repeat protein, partial [Mycobacterium sp.]
MAVAGWGAVYRATALAGALLLVTVVGCSSPDAMPTATSSSRPGAAAPATVGPADWPTYHHDNARSGVAPQMSPVGSALGVGWRAELDGAVYGQPLVIGNQVIAATENDTVYALSANDGQVVWSVSLGQPMPGADLPCGDIDPLGITGTPAYDPDTGVVFVVAETADARHTLA